MPHKLFKRLNSGVRKVAQGFDDSRVGRANLRVQGAVGRKIKAGLSDGMKGLRGGELEMNRKVRERNEHLKRLEEQTKAIKKKIK